MKNVCFTGHRVIVFTPKLEKILLEILENLIINGATDFYAGGAIGWDMFCEKMILKLREQYSQIKLHLILPCPLNEQIKNWKEADRITYHKISSAANTIKICSEHYHKDCMKKRNIILTEIADCCVCYYNNRKYASGTGQTVRIAQKKGIKIINLYQC